MKKIVSVLLVCVLVLGVFTACSKKTDEGATTTTAAAAAADGREVTVDYKAEKVKAKINLPEFGDFESETEEIDGEGATFAKIYTANPDKQAYADVELHLTIATEEFKQKTLAGERESVKTEVKQMKINGYEGCLYKYPEDGERSIQYFLYTTRDNGDVVELAVLVQDTFSDLSEEEWTELCATIEQSAAFKF